MSDGSWLFMPLLAAQTVTAGTGPAATASEYPVVVTIDRELSSKSARIDEYFPVRLAEAVVDGPRVLLPAGLRGEGQVVHVSRAKGLGKPGELIVAVRYLQCGSTRIALRGFRIDGAGRDKRDVLLAASLAGGLVASPLFFIKGGEYVVPAGMQGRARLAEPLVAPPGQGPLCSAEPAASPMPNVSRQGENE